MSQKATSPPHRRLGSLFKRRERSRGDLQTIGQTSCAFDAARDAVLGCLLSTSSFESLELLQVPRESGRIGKRVRFPRGPATVMLSKLPATRPLI